MGKDDFTMEEFETDSGALEITYVGHGTLAFRWNDLSIHVDPVSEYTDYGSWEKADIILVTHHHGDHLDPAAINKLRGENTVLVMNSESARSGDFGSAAQVLKNGESLSLFDLEVKAVPAYNTTEGRDRFHPKGRDNGYLLGFGNRTVYVAGDTEVIPEMEGLGDVFIAFLPVNQPYTMTPEQAAEAAGIIDPDILIPYHFGDTDAGDLVRLLDRPGAPEVRVRDLA